jgi:hypothetical protein
MGLSMGLSWILSSTSSLTSDSLSAPIYLPWLEVSSLSKRRRRNAELLAPIVDRLIRCRCYNSIGYILSVNAKAIMRSRF